MADEIMKLDLYELIGTVSTASVKEIKTAYRKKALTCHPDKNPDNPRAGELFNELKRALEILIDDSARAAYDKVLNARKQAKARIVQLDSKRRKLQEDLEAREQAYYNSLSRTSKSDEEKLKSEIERLQKEGSRQVEEEVEFIRKKIYEEYNNKHKQNDDNDGAKVKIKWKSTKDDVHNGGYNYDNLHQILSKYGSITALVVSTNRKGRALVEYKNKSAAVTATQIEIGYVKNPLSLKGLWNDNQAQHSASNSTDTLSNNYPNLTAFVRTTNKLFPSVEVINKQKNEYSSFSSAPNIFASRQVSGAEFENSVLRNMRRAEERKRLIDKLMCEEDEQEIEGS